MTCGPNNFEQRDTVRYSDYPYHSYIYSYETSPSVYFYKLCVGYEFCLYLFLKIVHTFKVAQAENFTLLLLDLLFKTTNFFLFTNYKQHEVDSMVSDDILWLGNLGNRPSNSLPARSVAAFLLQRQRPHDLQSLTYFLSGPLYRKFIEPCSKSLLS